MEFAIVCPADAFNVDAVGRVAPAGQAVTNVDAVGPVTVKFTDTADTPEDGIPPRPVICTVIVRPGPTFTASTCVDPELLKMLIAPDGDSFTIVELAMVWLAAALSVDAVGRAAPIGHAVTNVADVGAVTVKFTDTAETPDDGMPPRPVICTVIV